MEGRGNFVIQKQFAADGTVEFNVDQRRAEHGVGGGLEGDFYASGTFGGGSASLQAYSGKVWIDIGTPLAAAGHERLGPVNAPKFRLNLIGSASPDLAVFFYSTQELRKIT